MSGLTTIAGGLPGEGGALPLSGVLANAPGIAMTRTLSTDSTNNYVGQVLPGNETITGITASFQLNQLLSLVGTTVTITAQVFVSSDGGATYSPLAGTVVTLAPALTGIVASGATSNGTVTGLNIPVPAGDLGMVVFSVSAAGISLIDSVDGTATAGVSYTGG